eukprot:4433345-Amphidinium_carterae.1
MGDSPILHVDGVPVQIGAGRSPRVTAVGTFSFLPSLGNVDLGPAVQAQLLQRCVQTPHEEVDVKMFVPFSAPSSFKIIGGENGRSSQEELSDGTTIAFSERRGLGSAVFKNGASAGKPVLWHMLCKPSSNYTYKEEDVSIAGLPFFDLDGSPVVVALAQSQCESLCDQYAPTGQSIVNGPLGR